MSETFSCWDSADYLETEDDIRLYMEACLDEDPGDGRLIRAALSDISRARDQSELARRVGLSREDLRKALSPRGNPSFSVVLKIARELGLELRVMPHRAEARHA